MSTAVESRVNIPLDDANASDLPKEGWVKVEVVNHDDIELSTRKGTPGIRTYFNIVEKAVFDPQSGELTGTTPAYGFLGNTFWLTLGAMPAFKAFYKACTGKSALTGTQDENGQYRLLEDDFLRAADECNGSTIWVKIKHEHQDGYAPKATIDFDKYRKSPPNRTRVQTED